MKQIPLWLAAAILLASCSPSPGEDGGPVAARGTGFDFYVLSLTWSPSYCAAEGAQASRQQCSTDRGLAFVVHGLWPQYQRGYPEFCPSGEPGRIPRSSAETMLDIMPSIGLIGHQWRKHGTCTGLTQADYLIAVREAFDRVVVPPALAGAATNRSADPDAIERAFIAANPQLPADGIAVTCADRRLDEVRICLSKDLSFRSCPEVDRRACRAASVMLPAAP